MRVAVFGAGISGRAAAELARSGGDEVVVFDERGGVGRDRFEEADLASFDRFVFSPGFAARHPWRALVEQSGRPCFGELGYAASQWRGRLYGITGTNGKTTLTGLLAKALGRLGVDAVAAGNIGEPFSAFVRHPANHEGGVAVCEISSFQAELPEGIALDGLVWTNFAEDHLDRYASMAEYFRAKARLFPCLKPDAVCVVGPQVTDWLNLFEPDSNACSVAYADPALIEGLAPDSPFRRFPQSENFSLAAEFWWLLGYASAPLIESANEYRLAPHRLDVAAEWGGVRYWNDSKATNFHAVRAALDAVERPIYWIGGGQSKGGDLEAFAAEVAGSIDAAFVYGEVGERLGECLRRHMDRVAFHPRCEDAIEAASEAARRSGGGNVLFSPGFSSFDQFSSYSERGKCFIHKVLCLKDSARRP